jgi:dephospho-CoA kinase
MIVGLTGGIATGKTTVTGMLRALGAYVVDADEWARKVVEPGADGLDEIVRAFGDTILEPDGSLSRAKLGQKIFHDDEARKILNAIMHPRVRSGMKSETEAYLRANPGNPVVWDVPLLFEGKTRKMVDKTILVYVDEPLQLVRLMDRNGYTEEEAKARIRSQISIEEKRRLADFLIDNRGTLDETREQVHKVWETLRGQMNEDRALSF